ncbi:unnamed protein product [Ostreobium quekettii]|uniref:EF-hand domain-containing protein n=1 Tax=Ostreobium quekettii TaxID=121088 RepID=A0A8S1JFU1_9CHLO|nr:unnamed protein product [Ostreobium quekettii]|eukprot:evm.model.scf_591.3 EVM.evm.TU.scf_591.3   scf_591:28877-37092(+)
MPRLARPGGRGAGRRIRSRRRDGKKFFAGIAALARKIGWTGVGMLGHSVGRFAAISFGDLPKFQFPTPLWVVLSPPGHPDKKRLMTVQDFFKYTEEEGVKFFEELDRDGDGKVSLEDMKVAMRKRKLPEIYAREFVHRARGGRWWSKTIGYDEFKAVVDERESEMLRAFTQLTVNQRGQVEVVGIKDSLKKLGLSATDANAKAMLRAIGSEDDGFVSYGSFRNFAILLPKSKLRESVDPSRVWFESATMVPIGLPAQAGENTTKMLLTAALAGGVASATSTFLMHPVDTLKTRIQSSVGISALSVVRSVPNIGAKALYRGFIPATAGSGLSHGVRMCAYEGCFKILSTVTGGAAEVQLQGLASGVGTILGTAFRIPCEVLKQRLQVGQHTNVSQALTLAVKADGPKGLFRGTGATLSREVPFYVFGMVFYQQLKKLYRGEMFGGIGRDLKSWETLMVGALSGALGAIVTTPADVMKTRIMTAAAGQEVSVSKILIDILRVEGFGALFKGALPRAIWIAPLGAMNFAGYELAKNALSEADRRARKAAEPEPEPEPEIIKPAEPAILDWFRKPSWWPELGQKSRLLEQPKALATQVEAAVPVKGNEYINTEKTRLRAPGKSPRDNLPGKSPQQRLLPSQSSGQLSSDLRDQVHQHPGKSPRDYLPGKSPRQALANQGDQPYYQPGKSPRQLAPSKSSRQVQPEQGRQVPALPGKSPRTALPDPGTKVYQQPGKSPRQPLPGKSPRQLPPMAPPGKSPRQSLPGKSPRQLPPVQAPPGKSPRQSLPGKSPRQILPDQGRQAHQSGLSSRPLTPGRSPRQFAPGSPSPRPEAGKPKVGPSGLPPRPPHRADSDAVPSTRSPLATKQPAAAGHAASRPPSRLVSTDEGVQLQGKPGNGAAQPEGNGRTAQQPVRAVNGAGTTDIQPSASGIDSKSLAARPSQPSPRTNGVGANGRNESSPGAAPL